MIGGIVTKKRPWSIDEALSAAAVSCMGGATPDGGGQRNGMDANTLFSVAWPQYPSAGWKKISMEFDAGVSGVVGVEQ